MKNLYLETVSLCPECAKDSPAYYEERDDGMFLNVECDEHGLHEEQVESDSKFFIRGYEEDYENEECKNPYKDHLVLPITYRCNTKCRYCYTLSNSSFPLPEDRTFETLAEIIKNFEGSINIIGGEPTIREDLLQLIRVAKTNNNRIVSISTNGQRLRDINFVKGLKDNGLDYVYLSLNDIEYEESKTIYQNKLEALNNCCKFSMPVWLQRTIDELNQLDSILDVLGTYKRVIFSVTIRAVKPFGVYYPTSQIFVSDMLKYLKKEKDYTKGTEPFNCRIILKGKQARISSWVNDVKRLDPIDCSYIISNDVMTTFHRGMKIDEVLIKNQRFLNV